jgi:hypothetical protein
MTVRMSNKATANGTVTITVGLAPNTVLKYGNGIYMERIVLLRTTSTTVTATLALGHSAGDNLVDQGCMGVDADDNDPFVWNTTQVNLKYGNIKNFFKKLGQDLTVNNPWTIDATTAAMVAGLTNPDKTFYFDNAGNDSNSCTIALPCKTIVPGATTHGYTATGNALLIGREGWNNNGVNITVYSGNSSKATVLMAYPGEQIHLSTNGQVIDTRNVSYLWLGENILLSGGADILCGTNNGMPSPVVTYHDNYVHRIDARGPFADLGGYYGFGMAQRRHRRQQLVVQQPRFVSARSLYRRAQHRRDEHSLPSEPHKSKHPERNSLERKMYELRYGSKLGLRKRHSGPGRAERFQPFIDQGKHSREQCEGHRPSHSHLNRCRGARRFLIPAQLHRDDGSTSNVLSAITMIAGAPLQVGNIIQGPRLPAGEGASITRTLRSPGVFGQVRSPTAPNGARPLLRLPARVPASRSFLHAGTFVGCPYDENYLLIEHNTIYNTGSDTDPPTFFVGGILQNAGQNAIQIRNITQADPTNPGGAQTHAGSFDHITFRNNILVVYGNNNLSPPISYTQGRDWNTLNGADYTDADGMNWMATAVQDSNLFWHSDGHTWTLSTGNILTTATTRYTCTTATAVFGVTASGGSNSKCMWGNPKFADANISYFSQPERFDLRLLPNSPALTSGSAAATTPYDFAGRAFSTLRVIGALQRNP